MGNVFSCINSGMYSNNEYFDHITFIIYHKDDNELQKIVNDWKLYSKWGDWPLVNVLLRNFNNMTDEQIKIIMNTVPPKYINKYNYLYHNIIFNKEIYVEQLHVIYRKKISWYLMLACKMRNWKAIKTILSHINYQYTIFERLNCVSFIEECMNSVAIIEDRWIKYKKRKMRIIIAYICKNKGLSPEIARMICHHSNL